MKYDRDEKYGPNFIEEIFEEEKKTCFECMYSHFQAFSPIFSFEIILNFIYLPNFLLNFRFIDS